LVQSRSLLDKGFLEAARRCLWEYDQSHFETAKEQSVEGGSSKVDYDVLVNDELKALLEAKSPSVMKKVGELLPPRGIELKWVCRQSLVPKILSKVSALFPVRYNICLKRYVQAALYLGLRQMEWLFLSCHNYWIVCRLVRDDDNPYLAYSPEITIKDSSEPFRAFLGAILSVVKDVPVERSAYSSDMELDPIEEEDYGPPPEDDIDDGSGAYQGSSGGRATTSYPATRSREHGITESGLIVRPFLGQYLSLGFLIYS
jgi:hypothetical protein